MLKLTAATMALTLMASQGLANCATSGLKVRCLYVGPNEEAQERSEIGARFVTVTEGGSEAEPGRRTVRHRILPAARSAPEPALRKGDLLPEGVLILMNPIRYGLPRPRDGWTYFTLGSEIYRADIHTRRVLNYINPHINRY